MKKIMLFTLSKIESIEDYLEDMERKGYRLERINHSTCFYFKKSTPKQMCYFLSLKSFRGKSMDYCDSALLSNYSATPVKSTGCLYSIYRTKEEKEKLSLLYAVRSDYVKAKLLEKAIASILLTVIFSMIGFVAIITQSSYFEICVFSPIVLALLCLGVYYLYSYFKQKKKCKRYEHNGRINQSFLNRDNVE